MNICGSETELARARFENDMVGTPEVLELFCDIERAIWGSVIDNNYFPVKVT